MTRAYESGGPEGASGPLTKGLQGLAVSLLLVVLAVALNLPWPLEASARAALPYLALAFVHWHAFRMPHTLPAPVVLVAGLIADIVADTPLGFWALIYLAVVASGRGMRHLIGGAEGHARMILAIPVYVVIAITLSLAASYLYTLAMPAPAPVIAGAGLGAALELAALAITRVARGRHQLLPAVATTGEH